MPNYRYHASESVCRNGCMRRPAAAAERGAQAGAENCQPLSSPEMTCGGTVDNACLEHRTIAMAYVPWQQWTRLYRMDQGFHRGTIFEELDKPFLGAGGVL